MTPPNLAVGAGSCLPSIVIVAVGEPGSGPLCAVAAVPGSAESDGVNDARYAMRPAERIRRTRIMINSPRTSRDEERQRLVVPHARGKDRCGRLMHSIGCYI